MFVVVESILGILFTNSARNITKFVNEIPNILSTTTNITEPNIFCVVAFFSLKKAKFTQL